MGGKRKKRSLEERRRIGAAVSARYRETLEEGQYLPPRKKCARCKETKIAAAFSVRKKTLKSGIVSENLESWCKECRRLDWHRRKAEQEAEGLDVRALKTAADRAWRKGLSPKKRAALRERMREAQAIQRRKNGHGSIGSRRGAQRSHEGERMEPGPLARLLEAELDGGSRGIGLLAERSGIAQRRIYGLLHDEYTQVALSTVDKLLHGMGLPHMLPILYPEEP